MPNFNAMNRRHSEALKSMVSPDRFTTGESYLQLHSKDQSHHPPSLPEAVIWPVDRHEVAAILKYANDHRLPITGWGSGSSLEGNPIPLAGGIVLDFNRMNKILAVRPKDFLADVEPGLIYQDLNQHLKHSGLFFPPDPGARATIGGMIANNAGGTRTVLYGSTKDYVLRLSLVLANGDIIELGSRVSKSSSGYDLLHLFVGSEGTLGIVVAATVRLTGIPEEYSAAVVTFPSVTNACKAVYDIIRYGLSPAALELMGPECIQLFNREKELGLDIAPTLFIEFHGPSLDYLSDVMDMSKDICKEFGCCDFRAGLGKEERNHLFEARHELGEMIIRNHPDCGIQIIDVAVPISGYEEIISRARQETNRSGLIGYTFSHAGDGNLHLCLAGKRNDKADWEKIDRISAVMVSNALSLGGTATGEHGVGIGKRKFMADEHGSSFDYMKHIKTLFDPNGILNPGKIF
jgi:D-lactate dehydrogenase (cytochrome)